MPDSIGSRLIGAAVAKTMRDHWALFLVEGIALVILGLLAIIVPTVATLAATVFFGWLLMISGVIGLLATIRARHAPGFGWSLASAAIGIAAGVLLLGATLARAAGTPGSAAAIPVSWSCPSPQVALQRLEDLAESGELFGRQGVGEVLLDSPGVRHGRRPEDGRPVVGERNLGAAAVGGAFLAPDQATPLHPPEVVGQPAALPVDRLGQP